MSWKRSSAIALAGLASIGLAYWLAMPRPITAEIAVVSAGTLRETVDDEGKTRVRERYVVSAPLAGITERIVLKPGDLIQSGQLIVAIRPNLPALYDARTERELTGRLGAAEAKLQAANASFARALAARDQAEIDLRRAQTLFERGTIAAARREQAELEARLRQRELDLAKAEQHAAEHDVGVAKAALERLRRAPPSDSASEADAVFEIRAPISGRVIKVNQESAAAVTLGAPLIELADTSDLEIIADLLTQDAVRVRPGAAVRVTGWGSPAPLQGRVRRVEPGAFTKISSLGIEEQRVNVVIDILSAPDERPALGDGFRVEIAIETFVRDGAVKVPLGALFRLREDWTVLAVTDGRAVSRRIVIGRRGTAEAEVLDGLKPGDQVIVYPSDRVSAGVRVRAAQ